MEKLYLRFLLAVVFAGTNGKTFYVTPISNPFLCQSYSLQSCFILGDLSDHLNLPQDTNLTLSFLPGEHSVPNRITIKGLSAVTLEAYQGNKQVKRVVLNCNKLYPTGLNVESINKLTMKGLVFQGCRNIGVNGGAISIIQVKSVDIMDCSFNNNQVQGASGGALYLDQIMKIHIHNSNFTDNTVDCCSSAYESEGGGAVYIHNVIESTIVVSSSTFKQNTAIGNGGAIRLVWICSNNLECDSSDKKLEVTDTMFINSNAITKTGEENGRGGAIDMIGRGRLLVNRSTFLKNSADTYGGAIFLGGISSNSFFSENSTYINNHAQSGGALRFGITSMSTKYNIFHSNTATYGGAVLIEGGNWTSRGDTYSRNSGQEYGGALYLLFTREVNIAEGYFSKNEAERGAGIYSDATLDLEIVNSTFIGNQHTSNDTGSLHTTHCTLTFKRGVIFINNQGGLYTLNSQINLQGEALLENNFANQGAGIRCVRSTITFDTESITSIISNRANYGGGVSLYQCTVHTKGDMVIKENISKLSGGGLFAFQSMLQFSKDIADVDYKVTNSTKVYITNNHASLNGGGMALVASSMIVANTYTFITNNMARQNGGGLHLEETYIRLEKQYIGAEGSRYLKLEFTNNTAHIKGGAIYISDETSTKELCESATPDNAMLRRCFIQVTIENDYTYIESQGNLPVISFYGNTAKKIGGDIYGGLFDRCTIDPTAELVQAHPQYRDANGLQYLQATVSFASTSAGHISSDAVKICFCVANKICCNYSHPTIEVRKGDGFNISLVAVDQVETPISATMTSSLQGGIGRLKEGQQSQQVSNHCTELIFNVYSSSNSVTLQLYAEGPCGNQGISLQEVNISFLPCVSPVGFQRTTLSNDCTFECDYRLLPYISNCSVEYETIQLKKNVWIQHVNTSNITEYLIQDCPYDYCVNKPVNITLSTQEGTDKQCAFNRTGRLCGQCAQGLSLVFASSQCWECTNHWLLLLIPFALAGVLLVAIVLLLHKAVDNGALHGLLFYANILAANHSIFYPFREPTILTVFVSWLNLDLGIETCFYNGMTSTAKVLLQLAFPLYIFALMGAIIVLVKVSDSKTSKVSGLLSKGKPVEGLCMLILLSYSKLLRTVIASLQFTTLTYPDGTQEIVWLYNANIQYFSKDHMPVFIFSIAIIVIGGVYTGLLLFGQCLTKRLTNSRYRAIIEAHYRPLIERYRYWIGLLLLARIIHYLVSALSTGSATILSAGNITVGLLCFKLSHALNNRLLRINNEIGYLATYKNVAIEALEVFCLINLEVLSLGTLYERTVGLETQSILVNTSIALAFFTFVVVLISSTALNIRSKEFYHQKCRTIVRHLKNCCKQTQNVPRYHQLEDFADPPLQEEPHYPDLQDPQPYTGPTQTDTTSSREDPPQPRRYEPPIITLCSPAITSTELREELLADTEENNAQVQNNRPRARPACTHQEIDLNLVRHYT